MATTTPPLPTPPQPGSTPPSKIPVPTPPPGSPQAGGPPPMPGEEGPPPELTPQLSFWQQPWVQNVLPFVTSLAVHAGLILIGLAAVTAVQVVTNLKAIEEQIVVPESELVEEGAPGGVQNVGLGGDPTRPAAQDEFPEGGTPEGWAPKPGPADAVPQLEGGGDGDSNDPLIGLGPGGGFGKGSGLGSGTGEGKGSGSGDGRGPLAPFGTPGGGGIGPKSRFMGVGGNARTIAFVCDASGSMINTMSSLKQELVKAITGLKSIQGFNVLFFQDEKAAAMGDGLAPATPENKRKAFQFLENVSTTGTTNPIPALEQAFKSKPQLIYLLTDADFPDNAAVLNVVRKLNTGKQTKVNTIVFVSGEGDNEASASFIELMKTIAQENGGVFKHVKENELR